MSTPDENRSNGNVQCKAKRAADAMLQCAEKLEKKSKKKSRFAEEVLKPARLIRESRDPSRQSQLGAQELQELRGLVCELDKNHGTTCKSRKASEALQPFIDGIARYTSVMDTLVQSDPTVSALVWGGAKFILQLAKEHAQHYEQLTDFLERLGPHLNYLGSLSKTFDWSDELAGILMKSYEDVLLFFEAVSRIYEQSGFKTLIVGVFSPFGRRCTQLTERLEKNLQSVRDSADAAHFHTTRKYEEDRKQKAINQWLQSPSSDSLYKKCIANRHPGTCEWLFDDPAFEKWEKATWQSERNERVLWIHGPPGIGKTFLAVSVVERLKLSDTQKVDRMGTVIYYFFRDEKSMDPQQPGKGRLISLLRSLARQLVDSIRNTRSHELPKGIWDILEESGGGCLSDIELGVKVVQVLLAILPRVHIVVDGLDECTDRDSRMDPHSPAWKSPKMLPWILERLVQDIEQQHGTVKWCFMSCPENDLSTLFQKVKAPSIQVNSQRTAEDVCSYLMESCNNSLPPDTDIEALGVGLAKCISACNFLYARLTLETLLGYGVPTREHLMKALCSYNQEFTPRYLRGLSLLAGKSPNEKELARRILAFVTVAERPLTQNELIDALAVDFTVPPGAETYSYDRRPKPEKFEELCAPLLELDRTTNYANPIVRFIHRTARDFLRQEPEKITNLPNECRAFFVSEDQRHLEFGRVCLAYLSRREHAHKTTPELIESLRNNDDDYAFLKYASIFWHQHLNSILGTDDVFRAITRFVRSSKFLTCIWVQSQYAPYQLARYMRDGNRGGIFCINTPEDVYSLAPGSSQYFADPLPKWLSEYNDDGAKLVYGCQMFIREFGLVLLRRRGGIRHCHPGSLGQLNFLHTQRSERWKALALEEHSERVGGRSPVNHSEKHLFSVQASPTEITIWSIVVEPDAKPSTSLRCSVKEWQISLTRLKPKLRRETKLVFSPKSSDATFQRAWLQVSSDTFAIHSDGETIFSLGSDSLDIFRASFNSECIRTVNGEILTQIMLAHSPDGGKRMIFRNKHYVSHGSTSATSYCWLKFAGDQLQDGVASNICDDDLSPDAFDIDSDTAESDSYSDSDSGSNFNFNSDSEPNLELTDDTGYSSDSDDSSATGLPEKYISCNSLVISPDDQDPQWFHFETTELPLRQSPPTFHPTKSFVLLPLDGSTTVVIDYSTGKMKNVNHSKDPEYNGAPVARVYSFSSSGDMLHQVTTTRDFSDGFKWDIEISRLEFLVDESLDVETVSLRSETKSHVSWISPYRNPFEVPEHPELPFMLSWSETHLYIVFGACEVYICRILLSHGDNETCENVAPKVEVLQEPAFLPASTTERSFSFLPQMRGGKEYALFAICGNAELPPALIWKDVEADLGGWKDYSGTHIGQSEDAEIDDMKGRYSCNALTFDVPIRSGLEWNTRYEVVCGGG